MASNVQSPAIGDYVQGGVVFYLDGNGGGMVCAITDQSASSQWGCIGININGADGTAIGTGAQNTAYIVAGCSTSGIAAHICYTLTLNGYTDWFLPSKDELNEMYLNKAAIDFTATSNGGTALADAEYWGSTEFDANYASEQLFSNGIQDDWLKFGDIRVRAVRAF